MKITQLPKGIRTAKQAWLSEHRGVLSRTAKEMGLSFGFVRDCYWGIANSKEQRVEQRFAGMGAPGFQRGRLAQKYEVA